MQPKVSKFHLAIGVAVAIFSGVHIGLRNVSAAPAPREALVRPAQMLANPSAAPSPISDPDRAWSTLKKLAEDVHNDGLGSATSGHVSWRSFCELIPGQCPENLSLTTEADIRKATALQPFNLAHNFQQPSSTYGPDVQTTSFNSVFYNPIAEPLISACAKQNCIQGVSFPEGSIIGRFNWTPIEPNTCTKIVVFQKSDVGSYIPDKVIVINSFDDDQSNSCNKAGSPVYPLREFLHVRRSQVTPDAFNTRFGPRLTGKNQIAVVLGFNLMEKVKLSQNGDGLDWVWSTFWWSVDPGVGGRAGSSCKLPSPCPTNDLGEDDIKAGRAIDWSNYVMNFAPSSMKPDDKFIAVSNPYLDGGSGIKSNCVVCHSFAMTPSKDGAGTPHGHLCGAQPAESMEPSLLTSTIKSYQTSEMNGCPVHARVSTDMVWTAVSLNPANNCGAGKCN